MSSKAPDEAVRQRALELGKSFIVQAPAGSGKTELLTQRFLKLLAISNAPEQVLAITFTKKAASEMRARILGSLRWAAAVVDPGSLDTEYDRQRYAIAKSVLERDAQQEWELLSNPARLRVQTIDSLCFYLAQQLPVLSQLGGSPAVEDDASLAYRLAVSKLLADWNADGELAADVSLLLGQLDNSLPKAETLLVNLLMQRDQWLPFFLNLRASPAAAQQYLHDSIENLNRECIEELHRSCMPYLDELQSLFTFAVENLLLDPTTKQDAGLLAAVKAQQARLGPDIECLCCWQLLANILLTAEGAWRKAPTKDQGFPAPSTAKGEQAAALKARKESVKLLLESFAELAELKEKLHYGRLLPDPERENDRWEFLDVLSRILMNLSGQLLLSFSELGMVDYSQIGSAARTALGDDLAPSDLALALDHRLQHVLVDEFQDTSQIQLELLQQLTQGWQPDDGRSVFLVGDAMQSCYGFRNANVGIYLRVRESGLGELDLEALTLSANFRSQANVVDWVNRVFADAFPAKDDSSRGAVRYSPSTAVHGGEEPFTVSGKLIVHETEDTLQARTLEAERIALHIAHLKQQDSGASIAILVRSRSHLELILPALRSHAIDYQATEIDRLGSQTVIDDLISLTLSILSTADRLSWFALLRAPWVGLTSSALLALHHDSKDYPGLWDFLQQWAGGKITSSKLDSFDADSLNRLRGFIQVMQLAMTHRYRRPLQQLVEESWIRLGGPSLVLSDNELTSAGQYFSLLAAEQDGFGIANTGSFEEDVRRAFLASPRQSSLSDSSKSAPVQLLTMHKAKGLEYDHVILPALGRRSRPEDKDLILWHERIDQSGENRLFLAALPSKEDEDNDRLYKLIRYERALKSLYEETRLLYIAVTRAKKSVLLSSTLQHAAGSNRDLSPDSRSLLARLWDVHDPQSIGLDIEQLETSDESLPTTANEASTQLRQSLRPPEVAEFHWNSWKEQQADDQGGEAAQDIDAAKPNEDGSEEEMSVEEQLGLIATARQQEQKRRAEIGIQVHRAFENILLGNEHNAPGLRGYWRTQLQALQLEEADMLSSLEQIEQNVEQCLKGEETSWLFDSSHSELESELSLSDELNKRHIIDLSFVDAHNTRWIIDFKTSLPEPDESSSAYCQRMKDSYRGQLARYRDLFSKIDPRPIRCALCLSAIPQLLEYSKDELQPPGEATTSS